VVQWLRDGLKIIRDAAETQPLAEAADPAQEVVVVQNHLMPLPFYND
jgi:glycerol kinase